MPIWWDLIGFFDFWKTTIDWWRGDTTSVEHESLLSTSSAGARLNVLESLQLERRLSLGAVTIADAGFRLKLCIRHAAWVRTETFTLTSLLKQIKN